MRDEHQGGSKLSWHCGAMDGCGKIRVHSRNMRKSHYSVPNFAQHSQRLKLEPLLTPSAGKEGQAGRQNAKTEIKPSPTAGQGGTPSFPGSAHLPATKLWMLLLFQSFSGFPNPTAPISPLSNYTKCSVTALPSIIFSPHLADQSGPDWIFSHTQTWLPAGSAHCRVIFYKILHLLT